MSSNSETVGKIMLIISILSIFLGLVFMTMTQYDNKTQFHSSMFGLGLIILGGFLLLSGSILIKEQDK